MNMYILKLLLFIFDYWKEIGIVISNRSPSVQEIRQLPLQNVHWYFKYFIEITRPKTFLARLMRVSIPPQKTSIYLIKLDEHLQLRLRQFRGKRSFWTYSAPHSCGWLRNCLYPNVRTRRGLCEWFIQLPITGDNPSVQKLRYQLLWSDLSEGECVVAGPSSC